MEAVMIPAKTVVHIGGVPVALAVDTIVETAYGNMKLLTGYHYAHLAEAPDAHGDSESSNADRNRVAPSGGDSGQ